MLLPLLVTPTLPLVPRNRMVDLEGRSRHPAIRLEADQEVQVQALATIHHHRPHSLVSKLMQRKRQRQE